MPPRQTRSGCDDGTRRRASFVAAEWPSELAPVRERVVSDYREFAGKQDGIFIRPSELFAPDGASVVMPVTPIAPMLPDGSPGRLVHVFGFTIVRLNLPLIERQILPSLVGRYFGTPRISDYHVAVIERERKRVVFEAEPGDAAALARGTDVAVDCFGIGPEQFPLLRQAMASLRLPQRNEPRRSMFFNMFRGRRPGDSGPPRPGEDVARWRLLVRHRAGSLEAAVSHARWRNLALSFGILMLMSVSVALDRDRGAPRAGARTAADGVRRRRLARAPDARLGHRRRRRQSVAGRCHRAGSRASVRQHDPDRGAQARRHG